MLIRETLNAFKEIAAIALSPTLVLLAVPVTLLAYIGVLLTAIVLILVDLLPGTNLGNESEFWTHLGPHRSATEAF